MPDFLPSLDVGQLERRFGRQAACYPTATPFPHAVMDDFFPPSWLDAVIDEFPDPSGMEIQYESGRQIKSASQAWETFGGATRHVIAELNSGPFMSFLEGLTGIGNLIPDPHLEGGGLHQIKRDGRLGVHTDFNWHTRLRLDRRLNLLLYLNHDWKEEWGGAFEMWSPDMSRCEQRVEPVFNRCVVFSTTDQSLHGHPDPLRCPPEIARRSIAMYYYSAGRPAEETSSRHTTLFRHRPGGASDDLTLRDRLRDLAVDWLPPAIFRYLQNRRNS